MADKGIVKLGLHVCNSSMFFVFVLLNFVVSTVSTVVTCDFQPKIIRLNEIINITCTINDTYSIEYSRRWTKGYHLICFNGVSIDPAKYKEIQTSENRFTLQIKNVSESDVNCMYQCRFGFTTSSMILRTSKDNFEYPPVNEVRAVVHTNASDRVLTIHLHFKKIFPLPTCTALIEGSSLSFNILSSKTVANYYDVNLRYQSTDKLSCNEEVVVKCKLIEEYIIPTKDLRKCPIEENPPKKLKVILLGTFIPLLLIVFIISFTVYCIGRKPDNELKITTCYKLRLPCITVKQSDRKSLIRMISSKSSIYLNESLNQTEACINHVNRRKEMLAEKDPNEEEDNRNSSILPEKQENVLGDGQLQRGDAISFRRKIGPFKYEHHGIVEKIIPGTTRFRIIHVTGTSKDVVSSISSNLTTGICSEVIDFERDTDIYKYTFMCGRQDGKNPAAVAEMFLDYGFPEELGFHILHFNCESFSRYCATGVVYSKQTGHLNEDAQIKLDALVRKNCKNHE